MWLWSHIFEEMKEPKFHIFLNPSLASLIHSSTNGVINNFGNPNADKHSNLIGSFEQGVTRNPIHNHYNLQPLYLESVNPKTNLRCSMACPTCSPKCTCTSLIYQSPFLNLPMRFVTSVTMKPVFLEIKTTLKIHGMKTAASSHVHQSFQELSTGLVVQQYHPQVHGDATLQFQRLVAFQI